MVIAYVPFEGTTTLLIRSTPGVEPQSPTLRTIWPPDAPSYPHTQADPVIPSGSASDASASYVAGANGGVAGVVADVFGAIGGGGYLGRRSAVRVTGSAP